MLTPKRMGKSLTPLEQRVAALEAVVFPPAAIAADEDPNHEIPKEDATRPASGLPGPSTR